MEANDPVLKRLALDLPKPALGDNRSHEKRLKDAIKQKVNEKDIKIPLDVLRALPECLLQSNYNIKALCIFNGQGWRLSNCLKNGEKERAFGLAIDLGSTSVVFYLVDFFSSKTVSTLSLENPQRAHGEDILERILFARKKEGLLILQREIIELINSAIKRLSEEQGINPYDIYYISVAGNTTMCHFLLALDPSHICKEPYIPTANSFDLLEPGSLDIDINPHGLVYCFPNVGSYFGGDLISGILASQMAEKEEISLLVDVGTNAEVVLGNKDWLVACAGAAGPALEGGILSCGMRAQDGAIERVKIDPKNLTITYKTINDKPPRGLCGSGIIDLLAAMFEAGLVEPTGKLVRDRMPQRIKEIDGEPAFILVPEKDSASGRPIYISQSDIKNLIRSKGAMYTILNVVIQSVGIEFSDIDAFYVAGAFGNYIDPERAITIGMLPDIPLERFKPLGNSAGKGAVRLLLEKSSMKKVEEICEKITYLEMNVRGDFMNQLTGALFLPHTDLKRFPSVAKRLNL